MVQSLMFRWNSVVLVTAVHKVRDRHCFAAGLFLTRSYRVIPPLIDTFDRSGMPSGVAGSYVAGTGHYRDRGL